MATGWQGKKPSEFIAQVETAATRYVQAVAVDVLQAVITGSPVDTGAYRANHRVSINTPDVKFSLDEVDKAGGATLEKGAKVMAGIQSPYGEFHIQNNLPYSEDLENGHSKQAEHGVYRPAFAAARAKYTGS